MMKRKGKEFYKKKKYKFKLKIFHKICLGYVISVLFIILLGKISYQKASEGLIHNYEETASQTILMTANYMELITDTVEAISADFTNDKELNNYVNGTSYDSTKVVSFINNITRKIANIVSTNEHIVNVHIIPRGKFNLLTSSGNGVQGFFEKLEDNSDIEELMKGSWVGYHKTIDNELLLNDNKYFMSYVKSIGNYSSQNALVVLDINFQEMRKQLSKLNFGENSIVGLVTGDGRELALNDKGELVETTVFNSELENRLIQNTDLTNSSSYISYDKEEYFFLYHKIGETNSLIYALVPKGLIMKQAIEIKNLVIIIVLLACFAAIVVGVAISKGISKGISQLNMELKQVSEGNLTTKIKINRKDEIAEVAKSTQTMIENMRKLISKVSDISALVLNSSESVSKSSKDISGSTDKITEAVHEISYGISQQTKESQHCALQVEDLSNEILMIHNYIKNTEKLVHNTKNAILQSLDMMEKLSDKSLRTSQITENVVENIFVLNHETSMIETIVSLIDEIAEQTNLLSLNASIEAARAGDAGKGFSVVSEEIKKLALRSKDLAGDIKQIVLNVQNKTGETVSLTEQAKQIVLEEGEAMKQTIGTFGTMEEIMNILLDDITKISQDMKQMDTMRSVVLETIENISLVSEKTYTASESVNGIMKKQIENALYLQEVAEGLKVNVDHLNLAVSEFII